MSSALSSPGNPLRTRAIRPGPPPLARLALLAVALIGGAVGTAGAHGTLVRGTVTLAPDPPRPGQPMVLTIDLANTKDRPVEGAKLEAELKPLPPGEAVAPGGGAARGGREATPGAVVDAGSGGPVTSGPGATTPTAASPGGAATTSAGASAASNAAPPAQTFTLQEYKEPYGTYRAQLTAPPAGSYTLTVHDRTDRGEDTVADVPIRIGGDVANGSLGFTFPGGAGGSRSVVTWLLWLVGVPLAAGIVVTLLLRRPGRKEPEAEGDET